MTGASIVTLYDDGNSDILIDCILFILFIIYIR